MVKKTKPKICINLYRVYKSAHIILWCKRLGIRVASRGGDKGEFRLKKHYWPWIVRRVAVVEGLWQVGRGWSKWTVKACWACQVTLSLTNKCGLDYACAGKRHNKMKAFSCETAQKNNSAGQMYSNWAQFTHSVLKEMLGVCLLMCMSTCGVLALQATTEHLCFCYEAASVQLESFK